MPLVAWLFAGASGPIDSSTIVSALEQIGFKFVGCTAVELEHDFTTDPTGVEARLMAAMPERMRASFEGPPAARPLAVAYHEGYQRWRARHLDLVFCFQIDGKRVCR
jgi:hypothetical protein